MGRPKKPTSLKIIEGNPGKRRMSEDVRVESVVPDKPDFLSEEGSSEWDRITPILSACGLLSKLDFAALCGYCIAYGDVVRSERMLQKHGLVVQTAGGSLKSSPYLSQRNSALVLMKKFLSGFGLDPSSRASVTASDTGKKDDDPLKKYRR